MERRVEEEFNKARSLAENVLKNLSGERLEKFRNIYDRILRGEIEPLEPLYFGTLRKLYDSWRRLEDAKRIRSVIEKKLSKAKDEITKAEEEKRKLEKILEDLRRRNELLKRRLEKWEDEYIDCLWWSRDCESLKKIRDRKIRALNILRQKKSRSREDLKKMEKLREKLKELNELYQTCLEEKKCRGGRDVLEITSYSISIRGVAMFLLKSLGL